MCVSNFFEILTCVILCGQSTRPACLNPHFIIYWSTYLVYFAKYICHVEIWPTLSDIRLILLYNVLMYNNVLMYIAWNNTLILVAVFYAFLSMICIDFKVWWVALTYLLLYYYYMVLLIYFVSKLHPYTSILFHNLLVNKVQTRVFNIWFIIRRYCN